MRFIIAGLMLILSLNMFAGGIRESICNSFNSDRAKAVAIVVGTASLVGGSYVGYKCWQRRKALAQVSAETDSQIQDGQESEAEITEETENPVSAATDSQPQGGQESDAETTEETKSYVPEQPVVTSEDRQDGAEV